MSPSDITLYDIVAIMEKGSVGTESILPAKLNHFDFRCSKQHINTRMMFWLVFSKASP